MTIDITLDDNLTESARVVGNHATRQEAVNAALEEYIRHRQLAILDLFHTIDFDPTYDAKQSRQLDKLSSEV